MNECRKLLGRVVGDRAIGKFVFGDETVGRKLKTYYLLSPTDVVTDEGERNLQDALRKLGTWPYRSYALSGEPSLG